MNIFFLLGAVKPQNDMVKIFGPGNAYNFEKKKKNFKCIIWTTMFIFVFILTFLVVIWFDTFFFLTLQQEKENHCLINTKN